MVINLSEICDDTNCSTDIKSEHIYLNPFQIIAINKRNRINSLTGTGIVYGFEIHTPDKVYTINYVDRGTRDKRFISLCGIWDDCLESVVHS